jgi:hypothetical protein
MAMGCVFFEKTRERKICQAASDERDGVPNARTTVDVTRRDRLAPAGAHTDSAAGRVNRDGFNVAQFSFLFFGFDALFLAREKVSGILRAR